MLEQLGLLNSILGLGLIASIALRLARAHPEVWSALGGNLAHLFRIRVAGPLAIFLFSARHTSLADTWLSAMIWALRAVLLIGIALLVLVILAGLSGQPAAA